MRHGEQRLRAQTAAAICAAAATLNAVQVVVPGGPALSIVPGIGAGLLTVLLLVAGPRLPSGALLAFGPVGASLVAVAVATTTTYGDGAVLYLWPAVWTAYFYGTRATAFVVAWIAAAHAVALLALAPGMASIDRWLDVAAAVSVVAAVVRWLSSRNRRLLDRLAAEARRDQLTGLLNRRGFDERLEIETMRAMRYGRGLAAISFDLDHFKAINDTHGHEMGDRVLACFGQLLAGEVRAADVAARTGGEEFVVLLPESTAAEARELAERVRGAVASGAAAATSCGVVQGLAWTVSGGVAAAATPTELATLLRDADDALYAAKAAGRDRIETIEATRLTR